MWRDGIYIRVKWKEGRAVQERIGGGIVGELAERLDAIEREERKAALQRLKETAAEWKGTEDAIGDVLDTVRNITAGVLLATGHSQRKRQWRMRNDRRNVPYLCPRN